MGYVWLRTWWVTSERSKPTGDPLQRATADSDLHGRELITNQHCLHTIELGNSALLTLWTLYVGWLYKTDFSSMYFFFFFFPFLWFLIWKQALMEAIQMELNVRCHTEIKLSAISQPSLDRTLFLFALIKMITRLSFALVNNVKRRVFSLTCGWLALEKHKNQPLRL